MPQKNTGFDDAGFFETDSDLPVQKISPKEFEDPKGGVILDPDWSPKCTRCSLRTNSCMHHPCADVLAILSP